MADARELIFKIDTTGADKAADDIKEVNKSMDGAKSKFNGLEGMLKTTGSTLQSTGGKIKDFGNQISAKGKEITSFGKSITKLTAPLTVMGGIGFKKFMELDKGIRQVSTLTNQEILPVSQIRKEVRSISDSAGIAQTEVAGAMYDALSSGVDSSKLVAFTQSATKLTKAGFTDMGTVIDATTTALNAYGDQAFEVSKIHDIFVKTQDKGKITVDELGKNIGRVIPMAAAAGVNLDQLGASYSILTAKGQNSRIATTNLNAMISELSKTGSTADKVLRSKTGKSFQELTKTGTNLGEVLGILDENAKATGVNLSDMFGQMSAGQAALTLLSDGTEGYTKMLKEMQNSDGSVDTNYEKMLGPLEQWNKAKEKMTNSLIDVGGAISPFVIQAAEGISNLVDKFSNLDPQMQSSIAQWGLLLVAAGPVISIFGTIVSVIGGVISVGGTLIGFVGSLVGGLGGIVSVGGSVVGAIAGILGALGPVGWAMMAVVGFGAFLISNWQTIKSEAAALGGGIKGYLLATLKVTGSGFTSMASKALGALNSMKQKWNEVKEFFKNPIKGVVSIVQKGATALGNVMSGGGAKAKVPSHATGLDYVPYDNYLANLHEGEIILTKSAANAYRDLGGDRNNVPNNVYNNNVNKTQTNVANNYVNNMPPNISNNTVSNAPNININVYGGPKDSPMDIAQNVRAEVENIFRDLRLQRA